MAKFNVITGGDGHDELVGTKAKDEIFGGGGSDHIYGLEGKDKLTGGTGADSFFFFEKSDLKEKNADRILDFSPGDDEILLSYKVFKHMGFGELKEEFFRTGKKAKDDDDHIIYDAQSGKLYYDEDGKGGESQILFGTVLGIGGPSDFSLSL